MTPIGQASPISQNPQPAANAKPKPPTNPPAPKAATLPRQTHAPSSFTGTLNPLLRGFITHAVCEKKDGHINVTTHDSNIPENGPAKPHPSIPQLLLASSIGGPTEVLSWRLFTGNINSVASTPEHCGKSFFQF